MSERLAFNRLLLTGPGRNYEVSFQSGVNVISGPIWTGKSSILQLLDYVCGAKTPPGYPEISKCSDVYVECLVGGEILTIRRSLQGTTAKATIYPGALDAVLSNSVTGTEVSARHIREAASVSSEVLRRIGLANITVKAAPTQDSSDANAFSLRDLLLLVYVDQERMGSAKRGFFEDHPFKAIKWKAGFEITHGLFDETAASLSQSLKEALLEEKQIQSYLRNAQTFLDDFRIPTAEELEQTIQRLDAEQTRIEQHVQETRQRTESQMGDNFELVRRRTSVESERAGARARANELRRTLSQLGRLRVQYDRERAQLEFLKESEALVGHLPIVRCPACLQPIEPKPNAHACYVCYRALPAREGEISVDARLRATKRRISDLDGYIADVENTVQELDKQQEKLGRELQGLDAALRRVRETTFLPDTAAVVDLTQAIALVDKEKRQAQEHLELRRKARGEGSNLLAVMDRVRRLQDEVTKAEASKASPEEVVGALSALFVETLEAIQFPEMRDSRIDLATYRPMIRNQAYGELSSRGAVSLAIVAWHLAVLRYSLDNGSRFPRLLMFDSPLNHVGHDATDEAFKDQQIVDAFYKLLLNLNRTRGDDFQVLIVDNRPPAAASELTVVNFTRDPSVGRFGLIDDEHPPLPEQPG
jgi:hypothetical protein